MSYPEGGADVTEEQPRFYADFARWWPLFSPPEEYVEEAADLLALLGGPSPAGTRTLLELEVDGEAKRLTGH